MLYHEHQVLPVSLLLTGYARTCARPCRRAAGRAGVLRALLVPLSGEREGLQHPAQVVRP